MYCTNKGRGPTKLISPLKTFNKLGNSSKLVALNNRPIRVSLCASFPRPKDMVLSLSSVNIFPFTPGRCCLKKTGLPIEIKTVRLDTPKRVTHIGEHKVTVETSKILLPNRR